MIEAHSNKLMQFNQFKSFLLIMITNRNHVSDLRLPEKLQTRALMWLKLTGLQAEKGKNPNEGETTVKMECFSLLAAQRADVFETCFCSTFTLTHSL